MSDKFLIVGLGNPGAEYALTRHNIGFMVLDMLAEHFRLSFKGGFKGDYAVADVYGKRVYFLKPQTYMNLSGDSVASLASYFKIESENILVVHDDLDMEFGKFKLKLGGSAGGHNGIRSIIACLNTEKFIRGKCGIGRPNVGGRNYVLGKFTQEEFDKLDDFLSIAKDAIICYLNCGLKEAMNSFNNKNIKKEEN
ncbi:aminoacyl-tRNA hydrolase [Deferribacteraceae bacterium V6Fe1]|nr:aminoacyl-tRNA hydrolase [Deferribacteraceae bacterium V6Fe1]